MAAQRWPFTHGIRENIWITHATYVEDFIKRHELKAVDKRTLQTVHSGAETARTAGESAIARDVIVPLLAQWMVPAAVAASGVLSGGNGGFPGAHFHFAGELYLLNSEQWKEFSGGIVKEFTKKLSATRSISFGQLMNLSDSMDEIV